MNQQDTQNPQERRPWVRPQLSVFHVGTQTQGGPIDWDREFSFSFWGFEIPITNNGS